MPPRGGVGWKVIAVRLVGVYLGGFCGVTSTWTGVCPVGVGGVLVCEVLLQHLCLGSRGVLGVWGVGSVAWTLGGPSCAPVKVEVVGVGGGLTG